MVITTEYTSKIKKSLGKLDDWIVNNEFIISGSFVISEIRDEEYGDSDLDIYVNYPFNLRDQDTIDSEFEDWIVENYGAVLKMENYNMFDIRSHKYIVKNGKHINIINLPGKTKDEIKQYIKSTSDLDICTCCYDGINVEFPVCVLIGIATEINKRKSFLSFKEKRSYDFKRKLRMSKYIERGFIVNSNYILDENFKIQRKIFEMRRRNNEYIIVCVLSYIAENLLLGNKSIISSDVSLITRILYGDDLIEYNKNATIPSWIKNWK